MSAHFSETDLLEIHYLDRTAEAGVAEHLDACARCTAQLASVREHLHDAASLDTPGEEFFSRQRAAVMERVRQPQRPAVRPWRFAAAAALVLVVGGVAVQRSVNHQAVPLTTTQAVTTASAAVTNVDTTVPRDVWETDAINEFQPLVDWESWEETKSTNGGRS